MQCSTPNAALQKWSTLSPTTFPLNQSSSQPANRILRRLETSEQQSLLSCMELVEIAIRSSIYEVNQPLKYAYFPESGVISIVTPMQNGSEVEVATIGNEGFVGLPLLFQAGASTTRAFCQVPGKAWRISAKDFYHHLESSTNLNRITLRYAQSVFDWISQTSACNSLHTIEERCARWLLTLHDRTTNYHDTFPLTQEFLAQMLGVQRSSVNLTAASLQKANLITYVRGKVTILDRKGLEAVSCECYQVIRRATIILAAGDCT